MWDADQQGLRVALVVWVLSSWCRWPAVGRHDAGFGFWVGYGPVGVGPALYACVVLRMGGLAGLAQSQYTSRLLGAHV